MRKEIVWALIGGAALVGAAVALHYSKGTVDDEDQLEEDIEQLGALEKDEQGFIKFDYFLKIFQICSFYGKNQFAQKKKDFIARRREALKNNDDKKYEEIVMEMTQLEESLVQQKLVEIIEKIGLSEREFQQNVMHHGQDQMKGMQIMQMQQQAQASGDNDFELLTREKAIETFKVQLKIQLEQMDAMLQDQMMAQSQGNNQEAQMQAMMKMMVQQSKAQDRLFEETGVEEDQLNASIQKLELQKDPEFMQLLQQNMAKVMQKAQAANPNAGMGGPMGMPGGMF